MSTVCDTVLNPVDIEVKKVDNVFMEIIFHGETDKQKNKCVYTVFSRSGKLGRQTKQEYE